MCKMDYSIYLLLLYYPNFNVASEQYNFNFTEIDNNVTVSERGFVLVSQGHSISVTHHAAIQIVIFAGSIFSTILVVLLLCSVCCRHYGCGRHHENPELLARSPSLTSIQEFVRGRLLDRPPTYHQSQNELNTTNSPPAYNEIISSSDLRIPDSAENMPASPPAYNISSKISASYANHDLNLPYAECESDTDSPPSYRISEGVVNPILLQVANNSPNESNSYRPHDIPNSSVLQEMYF